MERRSPLTRRTGLRRKQALDAPEQPLRRKAPLARGSLSPNRETSGERSKPPAPLSPGDVPFKALHAARGRPCGRCERARRFSDGRPVRAAGWHHWVPQQHLRAYVRGLRLDPGIAKQYLRRLLKDERNLYAVCSSCHQNAEHGNTPFTREEIPASAWDFARELGEWAVVRLERAYPPATTTGGS